MNFLNPGILGSREFFMNEFATPIDKFQEREIVDQLKKLHLSIPVAAHQRTGGQRPA